MKNVILAGIAVLLMNICFAQEFPVSWKTKFSFKPDRWFYDNDARYILGRSDEEAEVLDGATGSPIWKLNFKNDLQVKTLSRATYNEKEMLALFFNEDEKKKAGEKVIVDLKTGKQLWRADDYAGTDADDNFHFANSFSSIAANQTMLVFNDASKKFTGIDIRTGKVKWESKPYADITLKDHVGIREIENSEYAQVFLYNEDVLKLQILYMSIVTGEVLKDDSQFTTAGGDYERMSAGKVRIRKSLSNTSVSLTGTMKTVGFKVNFELKASGDVNWSKEFEGSAVRQIFTDAPYVKLDVQGDKIFVISKEITVFNLKTGDKLWSAPFDNCDASAGLKAKQEFGIAGWPLVSGNDIYYVDLRVDNAIKKVEGNTGKLIWKSEKLDSDDRVPNLVLVNGILVAQFGGMINMQMFIPNSNGGGVYKNENRFDGKFGVRTYDPANGKLIWNSAALTSKLGDKFSGRLTSVYALNNKLIFATAENLFCLDPKTGDVVYKTPLAASKIGDAFELLVSDNYETLYIFCDNGVAAANVGDGQLKYATKTGEIFWKAPGTSSYKFNQGKNTFLWVGEADFIGIDLATGVVKGKMTDNADPQFTGDGNGILLRDGEKITRFAVNK